MSGLLHVKVSRGQCSQRIACEWGAACFSHKGLRTSFCALKLGLSGQVLGGWIHLSLVQDPILHTFLLSPVLFGFLISSALPHIPRPFIFIKCAPWVHRNILCERLGQVKYLSFADEGLRRCLVPSPCRFLQCTHRIWKPIAETDFVYPSREGYYAPRAPRRFGIRAKAARAVSWEGTCSELWTLGSYQFPRALHRKDEKSKG